MEYTRKLSNGKCSRDVLGRRARIRVFLYSRNLDWLVWNYQFYSWKMVKYQQFHVAWPNASFSGRSFIQLSFLLSNLFSLMFLGNVCLKERGRVWIDPSLKLNCDVELYSDCLRMLFFQSLFTSLFFPGSGKWGKRKKHFLTLFPYFKFWIGLFE